VDKRLVLAVAGSGKTTHLVENLDAARRTLVLTYTEQNLRNLREKIKARFGHLPPGIAVMTYFTFLYSTCFRPINGLKRRCKGINFVDQAPIGRFNQNQPQYYFDPSGRLYVGRAAKLLCARGYLLEIRERLERFFDSVYVDEVQDFAGHDFGLLMEMAQFKISLLMVGDFRQHTYDTSRDGAKFANLHDDYEKYLKHFIDAGVRVDTETLGRSWRCSTTVARFVTEQLGIPMESRSERVARICLIEDAESADAIRHRSDVVKLFFKQHDQHSCYSQNWGASKGEDHYDEVCVVMTKAAWTKLKKESLRELAPSTLNKLYVALTRARGDVYLANGELF